MTVSTMTGNKCKTGAERLYEAVRGSTNYPANLEEFTTKFLAQKRITEKKLAVYHLFFEEGKKPIEIDDEIGIRRSTTSSILRELRNMYANYIRKMQKGTPLDDLSELSGKTFGLLERSGFATVEQLENEMDTYGDTRLIKISGLGKKNLEEIRRAVWNYEKKKN